MKKTYLFGPFVGELSWEMFAFAPYAIYLRRRENANIIVFSRSDRFDLYGAYANTLVPLSLNGNKEDQDCFTLKGLQFYDYKMLADIFFNKYNEKLTIKEHIYPEIRDFRYRLKWQLPRYKMDYDFRPRMENNEVIGNLINGKRCIFVDLSWLDNPNARAVILDQVTDSLNSHDYSIMVHGMELKRETNNVVSLDQLQIEKNCSLLGYIISSLRKSAICIGNLSSEASHMAILLDVPLVTISESKNQDEINLMNPKRTNIFHVNFHNDDLTVIQNILKTEKS